MEAFLDNFTIIIKLKKFIITRIQNTWVKKFLPFIHCSWLVCCVWSVLLEPTFTFLILIHGTISRTQINQKQTNLEHHHTPKFHSTGISTQAHVKCRTASRQRIPSPTGARSGRLNRSSNKQHRLILKFYVLERVVSLPVVV